MSKRMTVVVGAGANNRFDRNKSMPIGSELASRIQIRMRSELRSGGHLPQGDFSNCLSHSQTGLTFDHANAMKRIESGITSKESIDEFIDEWFDIPLLSTVAKAAICFEILNSEALTEFGKNSMDNLAISETLAYFRDSWLGLVLRLNKKGNNRRDFLRSIENITFITFNYDRIIEIVLYYWVRQVLGYSESDAADIVNSIPIYHVYGSLGKIPELNNGVGVPFGANYNFVLESAKNIITFTESVESDLQSELKDLVYKSDLLTFMGFGFHNRNLDVLLDSGDSGRSVPAVFGTCLGIRLQRIFAIKSRMGVTSRPFQLVERECHDLIWDWQDEIFG